jgi:glycosyltransferase involved in cell wall biosynthesis
LRLDCERFVRKNSLERAVFFVGKKNDTKQYYKMLDCVIIPSLWEGMPNVFFEALAYGKPLIATDVGGIRDIAGKLVSVIIVPSNNSKALGEALYRFCEQKEYFITHGEEGCALIKSEFSLPLMMKHYESFYATVVKPI